MLKDVGENKTEIERINEIDVGKMIKKIYVVSRAKAERFKVGVRSIKKNSHRKRQLYRQHIIDTNIQRKDIKRRIFNVIKNNRQTNFRKDSIFLCDLRMPPKIDQIEGIRLNRQDEEKNKCNKFFHFSTVIYKMSLMPSLVKVCIKVSPSLRAVISMPYPVGETETISRS